MAEFDSSESLEAPKVKGVRKSCAPKIQVEAGANGSAQPDFDLSFLDEELLGVKEEEPVVKKSRGRPKKFVEFVDTDEEEPVAPKPKRKQSEAQKQNFVRALEKRRENIALRKAAKEAEKQVKEEQQEAKKQIIEKKVLKKAKCLKKRELLEQTALDDLPSDEDIPDAIIEKVIKKQRASSWNYVWKYKRNTSNPKNRII